MLLCSLDLIAAAAKFHWWSVVLPAVMAPLVAKALVVPLDLLEFSAALLVVALFLAESAAKALVVPLDLLELAEADADSVAADCRLGACLLRFVAGGAGGGRLGVRLRVVLGERRDVGGLMIQRRVDV